LPAASFASYAQYRKFAPECRVYEAAVASYAAEIKPAAITRVVRAARACGHTFINARVVRESAEQDLRDSLEAFLWYEESDIQWHIANPGKRQSMHYAHATDI
jgi:hypothetical protein